MTPSSFTWLDYSERERREMIELMDNLPRERETRDELGLGAIRDALADLLFPGTSTIQTRARYFLFIPWIYLQLEARGSTSPAEDLRRAEVALIGALKSWAQRQGSVENQGIIGQRAGANLQRLPSSVYWHGMGAWGIRLFGGSQEQYHRLLQTLLRGGFRQARGDDGLPLDGFDRPRWHPGLPSPAPGFPRKASFLLTEPEATFLQERILTQARGTLLGHLVGCARPSTEVPFPWQHPEFGGFPLDCQRLLRYAEAFSQMLHGAALLYNLMLAERAVERSENAESLRLQTVGMNDEELAELYRDLLLDWLIEIDDRSGALFSWRDERADFWAAVMRGGTQVGQRTRTFVNEWVDLVLDTRPRVMLLDARAPRALIEQREAWLKRGLARLANQDALGRWRGMAGIGRMDFRWRQARRLADDILAGLTSDQADAAEGNDVSAN